MRSNQPPPPPVYTTRHYNYDPQAGPSYEQYQSTARPYPYYGGQQPPTTVTYVNDRNTYAPPPSHQMQTGGGMETQFRGPPQQMQPSRPAASVRAPPATGGGVSNSLNLSEQSPFHNVYGGYHYPSQIDPQKRITTQNTAVRSTDNKSLNLSDESPFFATYGHYHYPSQIDPQKRITEMPKSTGSFLATNDMSNENPFNHNPSVPPRNYPTGNNQPDPYSAAPNDWDRNSYQQPHYNQQEYGAARAPSPPRQQRQPSPPPQVQPARAKPSGPMDKTSLNMSPDNPFAATHGQHHYPSQEEIRAQKRANEYQPRVGEQRPMNDNRAGPAGNRMTEYPEAPSKEVVQGKGKTKFAAFDVNF